jgi:hypothetical protein
MRFFFDYISKDQSLYDYRGDEFPSTAAGVKLISLSVDAAEQLAA